MTNLQQAESPSSRPSSGDESNPSGEAYLRRVNDTLLALMRSPKFHGDDLSAALREVTEAAANCLEVPRASVWLYDEARTRLCCQDLFLRESGIHEIADDLLAAELPRYFQSLAEARSISTAQADTDERTNELAEYLRRFGIVSMLDAAIRQDGKPVGVVCLEMTGTEEYWTAEDETLAGNLADLVALLLETHHRRQAEAALRASESKFSKAFHTSPAPMSIVRMQDGQILDVNQQFLHISGYCREELIGNSWREIKAWSNLAERESIIATLQQQGSVHDQEVTLRKKNGEDVIALLSAEIIELENVRCILWKAQDVTELKQAEAQMRASEQRWRMLFEQSPMACAIFFPDGQLRRANAAWFGLFDFDEQSAKTYRLFDDAQLLESGVLDAMRPAFEGVLVNVSATRYDTGQSVQKTQSELCWFTATLFPLLDEQGQVTDVCGIYDDITANVEAEEAVRNYAEQFRAIVEGTQAILFSTDERGRFSYANEAAAHALRTTFSELIGSFYLRFVHPDDRWRVHQVFKRQLTEGTPTTYLEFRYLTPTGHTGWFSFYVNPLWHGTTVCGLTGVAQDITERKLAEEKIRRFNEELEQKVAQRTAELKAANQELEAFSYSVSHDLRAPLRHIDSFARLLNDDSQTAFSEQGRRYVTIIRESARRMGTLVDDLLQFSRLGRAEMRCQSVNLAELVYAARKELGPSIGDRDVVWNIADLPVIEGDGSLLRQVFVNLLSNALKYSRARHPAVIEVGVAEANEHEVVLFVRDNGVGFEMKYVNKLFGVFQRLHSAKEFEGTGIGLANVRRIIQRHGGHVRAESIVNEGATFYLTLPRKQATA